MILILFLLFAGGSMEARSLPHDPIVGSWIYDGFSFEGHRYPNPNPDLVLKFQFTPDQKARLNWHRLNESGFCEREAEYRVQDQILHQVVTWVNPENNSDCGRDPDMQLGRETQTRFAIEGCELHFYFDLNGREFIYILKRESSNQALPSEADPRPLRPSP